MKDSRTTSPTRRPRAGLQLFISYRRRFDSPSARLLKAELTKAFGEGAVFRDVDDIRAGEAFPESIRKAIESSDAFLLLISPGWLGVIGELRDPADFVRREVAFALARPVPVIPVLVEGARMPEPEELSGEIREFASRQACELSDTRWDYDVQRLVEVIRRLTGRLEPPSPLDKAAALFRSLFATWPRRLALAAALLAAACLYYINTPEHPPTYEACLKRLRVPGGPEATVRAPDMHAGGAPVSVPIVGVDQYQLTLPPPPDGLPLLIKLTGSGGDVGAVSLRFLRGDYPKGGVAFKVLKVVEPPSTEVTDYYNEDSKAKSEVYNWDGLTVGLGGHVYRLRLGDHGDTLLATLSLDEKK